TTVSRLQLGSSSVGWAMAGPSASTNAATRPKVTVLEIMKAAAPLMGSVLGWDEATTARELEHYRARVGAERDSQTQPDDCTADAARLGAPDVRTGLKGDRSS
ncbi:MAG: hypothetical protein O6705_07340, partial [Actinobacteria bacterium]|nr:hypothetical protein [Actinomycetota bacterium]